VTPPTSPSGKDEEEDEDKDEAFRVPIFASLALAPVSESRLLEVNQDLERSGLRTLRNPTEVSEFDRRRKAVVEPTRCTRDELLDRFNSSSSSSSSRLQAWAAPATGIRMG
jgi:hypothetical protein